MDDAAKVLIRGWKHPLRVDLVEAIARGVGAGYDDMLRCEDVDAQGREWLQRAPRDWAREFCVIAVLAEIERAGYAVVPTLELGDANEIFAASKPKE